METTKPPLAGAPVAVPAPTMSAIEPMRDLTEDDMRTIEQIVQERHGSVAVPAAREGESLKSLIYAIQTADATLRTGIGVAAYVLPSGAWEHIQRLAAELESAASSAFPATPESK